mgnify:CR=1 FL=1
MLSLASKQGERCHFLSCVCSREKVTKERRAPGWLRRAAQKIQAANGLHFLRSAPLPPPPRGEAVGSAEMKMTAEPFSVLNGCVVGIRRPNAGEGNDTCQEHN